jgi:hypothetical protein
VDYAVGALELIEASATLTALAMIERHGQEVVIERTHAAPASSAGTYDPATGSVTPPVPAGEARTFTTRGVWRNATRDGMERAATVQEDETYLLVAVIGVDGDAGATIPFAPFDGDAVVAAGERYVVTKARPFKRLGTVVAWRLSVER